MALQLGELSIALELENDKFRAGLANAKRDLESVPPAARREMVKVSRVMDEEGRKSGGLLARGITSGLMRNSPLIVAGIGAALAAGAPIMTAAAGALFAGVGAVAAAQTVEVRSAWTELGKDIRDGAVADAAVLVPVYVEMARELGSAFDRLRPQLREGFAASAPLVRSFTGGIIDLAENAMPGLVRAVQTGQPVFDGLRHVLSETGEGLGDFFDILSGHAPAAGTAFASLGDILGDLLPILGELLGQGAELAADVLPAVAVATGLTLDVLQSLGPLLPAVAAGFAAFKVAKMASGWLGTFSTQLSSAGTSLGKMGWQGEVANVGMRKASSAVSAVGSVLPAVGIAVGVVSAAMAAGEQQADDWARALVEGGTASAAAMKEMADPGIWDQITFSISNLFNSNAWSTESTPALMLREAREEAEKYLDSLAPVPEAKARLSQATNDLSAALEGEGEYAGDVAGAQAAYDTALKNSERASADLELAIHGVSSAMIEQANQALAAIDSGFAYRQSLDDLEDAQAALNTAITEHGAGSEQAQRMQLALEEQSYRTARAFGQQQADLSGLSEDSLEYKRIVQEEMLGELQRLHDAAGPEMKAAIAAQITALQASGVALTATSVSAGELTGRMQDLGLSVHEIPGSKYVRIDAPTEEQKQRLRDLGYTVTNIPGSKNVIVTADTGPAAATLAALVARNYTIQVRAVMPNLNGAVSGSGRMGTAATGGRIRDVVHGFSGGGKLSGPGTPTSDSIPALTYSGNPLLVSDEEWVIQAKAARQYGDGVMAAINAGVAQVSVPGRRLASGGPAGGLLEADRSDRALFHADTVNVIEGTPQDVAQELAYQARTRGW